MLDKGNNIVFYDVYCYLCSNTVRLLLYLDWGKRIRFSTNFEESNIKLKQANSKNKHTSSTVIFLHNNRLYYKSEAIEKIGEVLGGGFRLFLVFKLLPLNLKDKCYDWISRNRYHFLGKRNLCHTFPSKYKDRIV